jgi:hypothetical protein
MADSYNKVKPPFRSTRSKIAAVSLSVLLTILVLDFGIRTMEASKLVLAIENSEMVFETFNSDTKDVSMSLYVSIAQSTAKDVYSSGVRVDDIRILPWHKKLNTARDNYLEHNKAWYKYLSTIRIQDGDYVYEGFDQIGSTWIQVKYSLPGAIPSPDLFSLNGRTYLILSD